MDNITHVITLLQALVSEGGLASGIRREIMEQGEAAMRTEEFQSVFVANVERYVNAVIEVAQIDLSVDDDDFDMLGSILGSSFGTGLIAGLSIGLLAGEAGA